MGHPGSEVYLSVVDARQAPFSANLKQLGIHTVCTNRDLPLQILLGKGKTDFTLETGAPVKAIRCISGPTKPRPSLAHGDISWRLISHLSLNYMSLADKNAIYMLKFLLVKQTMSQLPQTDNTR